MAGIILKTKFISASNSAGKGFVGYIQYIDRPEAARPSELKKYDMFGTYQDYMGNKEKSSGLFTSEKDSLDAAGKETLKKEYDLAQKKGSNLYQVVISFETDWLKKHGLLNKDEILVENKIREYTRSAVSSLLVEEDAESWVWSAAIHYNTDHYHVHIAMVDPEPSWIEDKGRCRRNKDTGELYQRGKFKLKSIEKAKSTFVNLAIESKEKNNVLNEIIRDRIVVGKKSLDFNLSHNNELQKKFFLLLKELPEDSRLWKYNMNAMTPYRAQIDELSQLFIENYFKDDYEEFLQILKQLSESYEESYGDSNKGTEFYDKKHSELFSRLGNAILRECRDVRKEQKELESKGSRNIRIYLRYQRYNKKRIFQDLKNVFRKDISSLKNQAAYERMIQEENEMIYR